MPNAFEVLTKKEEQIQGSSIGFYDRLQAKMNDQSFMMNLVTILLLVVAFGAPVLYFGFIGQITLEALLSWNLGVLAVMSIAIVTMIRLNIKSRAFYDEHQFNEDLKKTENGIDTQMARINDHVLGHKFKNEYNRQMQASADESATDLLKDALNRKMAALQIAGKQTSKRYARLQKRLNGLSVRPKRGKYKPVKYDEIVTHSSSHSKNASAPKNLLNYNPKKESIVGNLFSVFAKGFGIGGAGSIPFLFTSPWRTIVIFYLTLFLTLAATVIQTYIKIRYRTGHQYLEARKFKLQLLTKCADYVQSAPKAEELLKVRIAKDEIEAWAENLRRDAEAKQAALLAAWDAAIVYNRQFDEDRKANAVRKKAQEEADAKMRAEEQKVKNIILTPAPI